MGWSQRVGDLLYRVRALWSRTRLDRELGRVERHREQERDARGVRSLETLGFDVRLGIRSLRRTPAGAGGEWPGGAGRRSSGS